MILADDEVLVAATNQGIYRSTNLGVSWDRIKTGIQTIDREDSFTLISPFVQTDAGDLFTAITLSSDSLYSLFRSTDDGLTWTPTGLTLPSLQRHPTSALRGLPTYWPFPTARSSLATEYGISLTDASMENVQPSNTGLHAVDMTAIAFDSKNELFVGTSLHGVFRSSDRGLSWQPTNEGLTDPVISLLKIDKQGTLFAGTQSSGFFRSTDNGDSWTPINEGIQVQVDGSIQATSLSITPDRLFANALYYSMTMETPGTNCPMKTSPCLTNSSQTAAAN